MGCRAVEQTWPADRLQSPVSLRIALLCEFDTVNGGEASLLTALESLRGTVEPIFLAPPQGRLAERIARAGWRHVPWSARSERGERLPTDRLLGELQTLIDDLRPDLLHANSLSMGRLTGALSRQTQCPCSAHMRDILRLSAAAIADLNANVRLLAVSAATRDFHVAQGVDADRIRVVYNGVDTRQFAPAEDRSAARRRGRQWLGLPDDAQLCLTIGQIGLRKGLDILAAAAPMIVRSAPRAHFLIVGERYSAKRESIDFEQDLLATFQAAGLADRLHRLGYRTDILELLQAADLLIHPARQEPFGRVLLEAAATGTAIVATRVGGTPELISDGVSGALVPANDPQSLGDAASRLLTNPAERDRLGAAAREAMLRQFQIGDRAQHLLQSWQEAAFMPRRFAEGNRDC